MSAPNGNREQRPYQRLPPGTARRGRPQWMTRPDRHRLLRDENISPPRIPPPPPLQIPTLRPASIVPPVRPALEDSRRLVGAQRRILDDFRAQLDSSVSRNGSATTMERMRLAEAQRQLEEVDRNLGTAIRRGQELINLPHPMLDESEHHPPKRRRLNATPAQEDEASKIHQVNYGYEGQVVPGKLNMTLQYCDGGVFEEGICCVHHNIPSEEVFGVQNIFKDDKSVYCTKGSRCNIIIKHEGGRAFTMKELIIKAPRSGYTSPVKEGMVFVGMDVDELMVRTAQYKIQYDKAKQKRRRSAHTSIRYYPDGSSRTVDDDSVISRRKGSESAAVIPEEFIGKDEGYKVETLCTSDVEEDEDDDDHDDFPWSPTVYHPHNAENLARYRATQRLRRTQRRVGEAGSFYERRQAMQEEDEEDSPVDTEDEEWYEQLRLEDIAERRLAGEDVDSDEGKDSDSDSDDDDDEDDDDGDDEDAEENKDTTDSTTAQASTGANGDNNPAATSKPKMLQAITHFSISKNKSTCRMVFEPAISARYILLKLYCPDGKAQKACSRRGNIDIKNVTVKGWCGPRVFQSVQMM